MTSYKRPVVNCVLDAFYYIQSSLFVMFYYESHFSKIGLKFINVLGNEDYIEFQLPMKL